MADNKDEKGIDLLELARKLWDNKKFIIKVTLIGAVIGVIIAFSIPREYTSTVIFTTNSNDLKTGNMGALASLAGINLNIQNSETFSPELYPNIINSTSFIQGLLNINVRDMAQEINMPLYSYLKDGQISAWWNYILRVPEFLTSLSKSDQDRKEEDNRVDQYFISKEEMKIIEKLIDSYSISTERKTGITTFRLTCQSPIISAFLADTITSYLQSYIIKERTKKSQTDLENSYKLYIQYKETYNKSQHKLAEFVDRNKNIISESYRFKQKKLEDEANLAYAIYNQMAQQVQMNEIKVQDDTPMFTIIQPAIAPIFPNTSKKNIVFVLVIFSFVGSLMWIYRREIKGLII